MKPHGWTSCVVAGIVLSLIPHDMMYGTQAALIAESFTGRLRYSGASLGTNWLRSLPAVQRRSLPLG